MEVLAKTEVTQYFDLRLTREEIEIMRRMFGDSGANYTGPSSKHRKAYDTLAWGLYNLAGQEDMNPLYDWATDGRAQ